MSTYALTPKQQNQSTYQTAIPGTAAIGSAQDAAKLAYQNAQTRLAQKRNNLLLSSGYKASFGTDGSLQNLGVDPNNPTGGLQQMLRSQAMEDQNAEFLGQERGLRGGLAHQASSDLAYGHGAQTADFGRNLTQQFGGFADEQRQNEYDYNNALYEAQLEASRNAIAQGNYDPGNYNDGDYTPPDGGYDQPTSQVPLWTGDSTDTSAPRGTLAPKPIKPKVKPKAKVVQKVIAKAKDGWQLAPAPKKPAPKPKPKKK